MSEALIVNSLTEASLYLALVPCRACGASVQPQAALPGSPNSALLVVPTVCPSCNEVGQVRFDLRFVDAAERGDGFASLVAAAEAGQVLPINRTDRSSRVIDVAGWLTLHARLCQAARAKAAGESSRDRKGQFEGQGHLPSALNRQLQLQAGQCLEEALKFYDHDNDLPPEEAFFTDAGRRQFREHPESFLRPRLISLRAMLPIAR